MRSPKKQLGFGKANLAALPEGWECTRLANCVADDAPICYGILKPGPHHDNGVPVIKVRDYISGMINLNTLLRTSPAIDYQFRRSKVQGGDILLSIRGTTGEVAIVPESLSGANITQDTARLRIRNKDLREFLIYAMQGPTVQEQIRLNTIGQAVKGINIAQVRNIEVALPPLLEQKKIIEILSTWNTAIAWTTNLIQSKTLQKQALMQ